MERQRWIDICKGIAIILVVIGHVVTSYHNSGLFTESPVFNYVGGVIYAFHMPLFFMISGYVNRISYHSDAKQIISKRLISYGFPYIIFSVLIVLAKMIASPFVNSKLGILDLFKIIWYPINSLWFLYALLVISVVHELLNVLIKEPSKKSYMLMISSFFLLIIANLVNDDKLFPNSLLQDSILIDVLMYAFWYELGTVLPVEKMVSRINTNNRITSSIIIVVCFVVYITAIIKLQKHQFDILPLNCVLAFVGSALICFLSLVIKQSNVLETLGRTTLPIYIIHPYIVSGLKVALHHTHILDSMDVLIIVAVSTITVLLSFVGYKIVKKYKVFDFCFYPLRYMNEKKRQREG